MDHARSMAGVPMRILHVVPSYLPATRYGGPIYSVHGLAKALAARGHDVHVFTTNADGDGVSDVPLATLVDLDGVKVWYFARGLGRRLYHAPAMRAELARSVPGFDVVHTHAVFLWPPLAAARIAERARVPHVMAPRGMLVSELIARKSRIVKSAWIRLFERRSIEAAAAVHVTSQVEAEGIASLGLRPRRIAVIANGIDMPDLSALCTMPATDARPYVLSLGRINWKKGLDRLIAAMQAVPDTDLVLAGNDEEGLRPHLAAQAAELGLAQRVRFLGEVRGDAKWLLIAGASLFALPSHNENFGIAVLEAMACAVPVVVTPEVGLAATVKAAGAGLVVAGEPAVLGRAIAGLLADPGRGRAMGAAGRAAAEQQFSWAAIGRQVEALYHDIGAARRPGAAAA
jgi:glycosyltransferase involved in cell wall biosynthesis